MPEYSDIPEGFKVKPYEDIPEGFEVVEQEAPEKTSTGETVGRGIGLAARDLIEGPASLAGVVTNPLMAGVNAVSNAVGGPDLGTTDLHGSMSAFLTSLGVPEPESEAEKIISNINQAVTAGGGPVGVGNKIAQGANAVTQRVGQTLAANPLIQGASAVSGQGAVEVAKANDASPGVQAASGIAASLLPGGLAVAGPSTVRGAFRGTSGEGVQRNIDNFAASGTTPTVGQATEGRVAQAAEGLLSRTPGSAGVMARKAERQAEEVSLELERKAQQLVGRKTTAEQAGRAIEDGIKNGFMQRFRAKQKELYSAVDDIVSSPDARVSAANYKQELDTLTKPISGAEATSKRITNNQIAGLAEDLSVDAPDGQLPYAALSALRSRIGEKLSTVSLAEDIDKAALKKLYAGLSKDMEASLADNPRALSAWKRANSHTRAGHARIDIIESVIKRKGGPEKIYNAALAGTRDGATTLRSVMQSLDSQGRRVLSAAVIRRMGLANPSGQDAANEAFSTETFLTNWSKMSKEAKGTLFNRFGSSFRKEMDQVAEFAENVRTGNQAFRNPSGTSQANAQGAAVGGFVLSVLTGQVGAATSIAGSVAAANLSARLMTNPNFVKWLAHSTKMPVGSLPAAIVRLEQEAKRLNDTDLAQAVVLLQESQEEQPD